MEVEVIFVIIALILPLILFGMIFYSYDSRLYVLWYRELYGSLSENRYFQILLRRYQRQDLLFILVFGLLHLHTFIGKLYIDAQTGKLAKSGYFKSSTKALGMNGLYSIVFSLVFMARGNFLLRALSISAEKATMYHIWCGQIGTISLTLHGLMYSLLWINEKRFITSITPCFECPSKESYRTFRNFFGMMASLTLLLIYFSSLENVRRRSFRFFRIVHGLVGMLLVFTCLHYLPATAWFASSIILYLMYRISAQFTVTELNILSASILSARYVHLELRRQANSKKNDFQPGQFVYIKVPSISQWEWHPFTISSSPLRNHTSFTLDVKVHGRFTRSLRDLIASNSLSTVLLDGYYGSKLNSRAHMIFVAGGSGMTPFLSMLEHFYLISENQDDIKLWSLPKTIWIVWVSRDNDLLEKYKKLINSIQLSEIWKTKLFLYHSSEEEAFQIEEDGVQETRTIIPISHKRLPFSSVPFVKQLWLFIAISITSVVFMSCFYFNYWGQSELPDVWWKTRLGSLVGCVIGASVGGTCLLKLRILMSIGHEGNLGEKYIQSDEQSLLKSADLSALTNDDLVEGIFHKDVIHHFKIQTGRPKWEKVFGNIHAKIKEEYGERAEVSLLSSGPHPMQRDVQKAIARLCKPHFYLEEKSFVV
jgi:predicted ferric reductase